jgi:hypothetical protein
MDAKNVASVSPAHSTIASMKGTLVAVLLLLLGPPR